jgi:hypothetical protein
MARPVSMLDFSVYKPPEEYKLNHDAGIVNAAKWSVSLSVEASARGPCALASSLLTPSCSNQLTDYCNSFRACSASFAGPSNRSEPSSKMQPRAAPAKVTKRGSDH